MTDDDGVFELAIRTWPEDDEKIADRDAVERELVRVAIAMGQLGELREMLSLRLAADAYATDPDLIERASMQRKIASNGRVGVMSADEFKAAVATELKL